MNLAQVTVGGRYTAKVSGNLTTVKVLAIREEAGWTSTRRAQTRIDVVNERTGRRTTFRSAARLRSAVGVATVAAAPATTPPVPPAEPPAEPA
jgi:hypothetical protein